jgi:hypothetical protein
MKALLLSAVALLAAISGIMVFSGVRRPSKFTLGEVERYHQWRARFSKLYSTPSEVDFRMDLVIKKLKAVDRWNAEYEQYLQDNNLPPVTQPMFESMAWDDLTEAEFKKMKTGLKVDLKETEALTEGLGYELPIESASVRADSLGQASYVHKIRNQGECGSCWAFSTIATLERHYFARKKVQIDLSQQELVDCSDQDHGCDGGWPTTTYLYIKQYGIQSAATYPYEGSQYYCERDETRRIWFDRTYAVKEVMFSTSAALNAATKGIVGGTALYSGGKFNNLGTSPDIYNAAASGECFKEIDHAVNIQSSAKDAAGKVYVVIQNSWGTGWGTKGVKKIYPCGTSSLWGKYSIISYTTNTAI